MKRDIQRQELTRSGVYIVKEEKSFREKSNIVEHCVIKRKLSSGSVCIWVRYAMRILVIA